ncbi:hypothetical protein [Sphingomicrobium sediminis]|uniref:Uncharacterized protein n=1 Tax=Sphingomicrobium sediminis TaxID=2950949 RepID=A0A9X2J3K9_9SPHN|nr:hypothetical protein [Sphingomicrobium sediminis]MCM8556317.1 hypothetical protein [Sphingomicrobium sediminis]
MTEQWVGDILDGVSVIVVLLLILTISTIYFGRKIVRLLERMSPPDDKDI